jgi:DNA mismatch repair protein MutS
VPGVADRSYGIQVARLAGLPATVINRASEVLDQLERSDKSTAHKSLVDDLPLFSATRPRAPEPRSNGPSDVEKRLAAIVPDELSPREALALLYELKATLPERSRP